MSLTLVKHDWPGTQGLSWAMAGCPGRIAIRVAAATKQNPATNDPLIASAANLVAPRRTSSAPADECLRRIANARMVSPLAEPWSARRRPAPLQQPNRIHDVWIVVWSGCAGQHTPLVRASRPLWAAGCKGVRHAQVVSRAGHLA